MPGVVLLVKEVLPDWFFYLQEVLNMHVHNTFSVTVFTVVCTTVPLQPLPLLLESLLSLQMLQLFG